MRSLRSTLTHGAAPRARRMAQWHLDRRSLSLSTRKTRPLRQPTARNARYMGAGTMPAKPVGTLRVDLRVGEYMTKQKNIALLAPLWLLALACAGPREISVGANALGLALDHCLGAGTDCATAPPEARPLDIPITSPECTLIEEPALHAAWQRQIGSTPCPPLGQCTPRAVRIAADGSIWTAAVSARRLSDGFDIGYFVGHYNQDGAVLVERTLDHARSPGDSSTTVGNNDLSWSLKMSVALAIPTNGQVVLGGGGLGWPPGLPWLRRIAASGEPIGDPLVLTGADPLTRLWLSTSGDDVFLMSHGTGQVFGFDDAAIPLTSEAHTSLAKVDARSDAQWVQSHALGPVLEPPFVDDNGFAHARLLDVPDPTMLADAFIHWVQYDPHGNVTGVFSIPILAGFDSTWSRGGDLIAVRPVSAPNTYGFSVYRFARSGELRWSRHVTTDYPMFYPSQQLPLDPMSATSQNPLAIDANDAAYFVRAGVRNADNPLLPVLYRVDADGSICAKAQVTGVNAPVDALWVSGSGAIYFTTNSGTADATVGRLEY